MRAGYTLSLNAGFIALTWACIHTSLLPSPKHTGSPIAGCESNQTNAKTNKKKLYTEELVVYISKAHLVTTLSDIRMSGVSRFQLYSLVWDSLHSPNNIISSSKQCQEIYHQTLGRQSSRPGPLGYFRYLIKPL